MSENLFCIFTAHNKKSLVKAHLGGYLDFIDEKIERFYIFIKYKKYPFHQYIIFFPSKQVQSLYRAESINNFVDVFVESKGGIVFRHGVTLVSVLGFKNCFCLKLTLFLYVPFVFNCHLIEETHWKC